MAVGLAVAVIEAVRVADLGGGFERGGEGALTTPYEILGRSERTTKCCSSSCSDGVKQLMSVPTARRTARPDVGEPSGTLAVTTILIPRCSSSIISSARPPAPHASMAASSALLGSGPTSTGGVAAVASIRADDPFEGTPPPMVTLKVTRSMRASVGSKDTIGAASTSHRCMWTGPKMLFYAHLQHMREVKLTKIGRSHPQSRHPQSQSSHTHIGRRARAAQRQQPAAPHTSGGPICVPIARPPALCGTVGHTFPRSQARSVAGTQTLNCRRLRPP